jgi:hypothetical protein
MRFVLLAGLVSLVAAAPMEEKRQGVKSLTNSVLPTPPSHSHHETTSSVRPTGMLILYL